MEMSLRKYLVLLVVSLLSLALNGCVSVKVVAEYDEQTDVTVTQIQRKMEQMLLILERGSGKESAAYTNYIKFYDDLKVDISAARVRAAAIPDNEYVYQQLGFMDLNVLNLERSHQFGISVEDIPLIRTTFNGLCTSIIRLELRKKRGNSSR